MPVDRPRYRLRRVFLNAEQQHGYYNGFANSALWPLCHRTAIEPTFFARDFHAYELVNRLFAEAAADEATERSPIVLVQDYHFALAPLLIRRQLPLSRIGTFWHIPWPRPETFSVCPWSRTLIEGLLGSTAIGFQTAADARNFLATVELLLRAEVDRQAGVVTFAGRRTSVGVFPASIEWTDRSSVQETPAACRRDVLAELGAADATYLGVSVDRLDYTKGLEQKFLAIERLLERRPDLVGRLVFAQLAQPCREGVQAYVSTRQRVRDTAARINRRFHIGPIRLIEANHEPATIERFFRAADFCYVGSLHDGMNLVVQGIRARARRRARRAGVERDGRLGSGADRCADRQPVRQRWRGASVRGRLRDDTGRATHPHAPDAAARLTGERPAVGRQPGRRRDRRGVRARPGLDGRAHGQPADPHRSSSAGGFRCFSFLNGRFDLSSCTPPVWRGSGARGSRGLRVARFLPGIVKSSDADVWPARRLRPLHA